MSSIYVILLKENHFTSEFITALMPHLKTYGPDSMYNKLTMFKSEEVVFPKGTNSFDHDMVTRFLYYQLYELYDERNVTLKVYSQEIQQLDSAGSLYKLKLKYNRYSDSDRVQCFLVNATFKYMNEPTVEFPDFFSQITVIKNSMSDISANTTGNKPPFCVPK